MTCYFQRLKDVFAEAGVTVGRENRGALDAAIRRTVGVEDGGCPAVWSRVKEDLASDEGRRRLVEALRTSASAGR